MRGCLRVAFARLCFMANIWKGYPPPLAGPLIRLCSIREIDMFDSVFKKSFNSAKCKTLLRLATSRIKLLRNKRDVQLKQLKRELAKLLETNQEPSAHIRVELIYREQNIMAAYDIIELLCDLLAARLPIIVSQRQCPIDLREAVASIIFAAPRCSDVPELQELRSLFSAKYGKEFTAVAAELRPDCGVNRVVVEKLSVKGPSIEVKVKLMKDIATEQGLDWDPTALESQNLKPPEDLLNGPSRFFGASQMAVQKSFKEPSSNEHISIQKQSEVVVEAKTPVVQNTELLDEKQFVPFVRPIVEDDSSSSGSQSNPRMLTTQRQSSSSNYSSHNLSTNCSSQGLSATLSHKYDDCVDSRHVLDRRMSLKGVADAAHAAAESAERAAAAARAAALLASKKLERNMEASSSDSETDNDGDEVSELQERSEENHFDSARVLPDDSSTSRMPLFDEPVEDEGSTGLHASGKSPFSYGKSGEEQSVSYSTGSYKFDDTESLSHSTTSLDRYVSDQASRQRLDSSISSSNNWRNQHNNTNFYKNRSFETAGAAPVFDTHEWDDPGVKPADEAAESGPPDRPPPQPPGPQPSTLTKSTSFVHPKLPDYDELTAHFQGLKAMRSRK